MYLSITNNKSPTTISIARKKLNDDSKYRYHLGQQPIFNHITINIFGTLDAGISS